MRAKGYQRQSRKRKREEHAALEVRAKKAEEDLRQSRADNLVLAGTLVRAAAEIRRLRDLLADRQVDATWRGRLTVGRLFPAGKKITVYKQLNL